MAKDPAVLFYTSDFLSGTFTMSNEQVGKYIRLLCLQHQKGVLSEKDMLSICTAYDDDIWSKFVKIDNGYINQKMYDETIRRQKFSESRRNNAKTPKNESTSKASVVAYAQHMETETETRTETITGAKTKTAKAKKTDHLFSESPFFDLETFKQQFTGTQYEGANFHYYHEVINNWSASNGNKKKDWIATAKNWMASDMTKGKFIDNKFNPNTNGNTKTYQTRTSPKVTEQQLYEASFKRNHGG